MRSANAWLIAMALAGSTMVAQTPGPGKQVFDTRCAMCHGEDGNGGEFAPGIVTRIATRTDAEIAAVVRDGLPNRGMPEVQLSDPARGDLIAYLRTLHPPRRGELAAIPVTIETTDSRKLSGVAVNQSYEDMQLRTADGRVHLLRREGSRFREVTSQVDWSSYDGQLTANRFSTLKQIDRSSTGKTAWELPQVGSGESRSGTLATAAGLVFFGEDSGALMAADSSTGKPLWSFQTSQSLRASPMTYMFDNKQLVALASGSNILVFGLD